MTLKGSLTAATAALAIGLASTATPASAQYHYHGGPGWHGGGGYGWHHGGGYGWRPGYGYGFWGPAIGLGIIAGAVAGGAYYNNCYRYQPIYDGYGNYVGRRPVNVC